LPTQVLDNMDEMQRIDKSNMLGFCVNAPQAFQDSTQASQKISFDYGVPKNVILAGLGGSAIGGELVKDYTRDKAKVSIEISREYNLPAYADKDSLVILASYSGDTEETLGSLVDAVNRKCNIFCLSSGGNLIKYAKKLSIPYMQVKGDIPPRGALPLMFPPLLKCLELTKMIPSFDKDMAEATKVLQKVSDANAPDKPAAKNEAKQLAANLYGTMPFTYGFGYLRGAALRYKQQFNENAKVPAKWEYFSELNHNETMGWEGVSDLAKCFSVVFLRDKAEPMEIRTRIEITRSLMQPSGLKMFEVWAQGKSELARMLSTILVGDFASVYLAYLRDCDPTPVGTVTVMKQRIEQNGVKKKILEKLDKLSGTA
jgi:glucose/mannose-6-phosphate isomerase